MRLLLDVFGILSSNFEFLIRCEVKHKRVEGIGNGEFAGVHLSCNLSQQLLKELVIILPVTTDQLGVQKGHQSLGLIHIDLESFLVVLKGFVQLPFEF